MKHHAERRKGIYQDETGRAKAESIDNRTLAFTDHLLRSTIMESGGPDPWMVSQATASASVPLVAVAGYQPGTGKENARMPQPPDTTFCARSAAV